MIDGFAWTILTCVLLTRGIVTGLIMLGLIGEDR